MLAGTAGGAVQVFFRLSGHRGTVLDTDDAVACQILASIPGAEPDPAPARDTVPRRADRADRRETAGRSRDWAASAAALRFPGGQPAPETADPDTAPSPRVARRS